MGFLGERVGAVRRRGRVGLKRLVYALPRRDRWQRPERVIEALGLRQGDRVADLGAGGGYFTFRLARAVGSSGVVYAVDTDRDMPEVLAAEAGARGLGNVVPVRARGEDPGLPEAVGLCLLVNVFHHLPDQREYFGWLAKHLKAEGRVAVIEATPTGVMRVFGHATRPEEIRAALRAAGYVLLASHEFLPRQSFQVFGRKPS